MGIGISAFFDMAGAGPVKMMNDLGAKVGCYDVASVRVHPDGRITVFAGSHSHGQGHETTWSQIAADRLGCDIDHIDVVEGRYRPGAHGHRHLGLALAVDRRHGGLHRRRSRGGQGQAARGAHDGVRARGPRPRRRRVHGQGHGQEARVLGAVANAAYHSGDRPSDLEIGLEETSFFDPADCTYPSAVHLCVVLVDPETCAVTLRNYWAVDDVGTVINPDGA